MSNKIFAAATFLVLLFTIDSAWARGSAVRISPPLVSFGAQTVNTSSLPTTVTLSNNTTGKITIVNVSLSLLEFTYSGPALPITLNPGQSFTGTVTFSPSATQSYNDALTFTRANGSTIAVALSGNGVLQSPSPVPPSSLLPTSLQLTAAPCDSNFNCVPGAAAAVGQFVKITAHVVYSGTNNPTGQVCIGDNGTQMCGLTPVADENWFTNSLAAGIHTLTATYAGDSVYAASKPASAVLTVGSIVPPPPSLQPTSVQLTAAPCDSNFNCVPGSSAAVGQFVKLTAHVVYSGSNNPTGQLCIADNSSSTNCGLIPVMDENWFTNSLAAGTHTLTASYWGDSVYAASKPASAVLTVGSSTSGAPKITTQPASQSIMMGQTATFSVAATGTGPLSYQWKKNGAAINGATSATYTTVATTASDNGAQFLVTVSNSVGSATSNAALLSVNSGSSQLTVSPSSLSFGAVTVGTSSALTATVTNSGNSNATISNVSVSGAGFNASGASGVTLAPGQNQVVNVTFAPSGTGSVSGRVTVTSNAANSPTIISLSGSGTPLTVTSITVTPDNQTVAIGTQVQFIATDNFGNDVTSSVTWSSSDTSVVTITPTGLATGLTDGVATISATK